MVILVWHPVVSFVRLGWSQCRGPHTTEKNADIILRVPAFTQFCQILKISGMIGHLLICVTITTLLHVALLLHIGYYNV